MERGKAKLASHPLSPPLSAKSRGRRKNEEYPGSSLRLVLRSDAKAADALVGVLAAAHVRAEILEQQQGQRNKKESGGGGDGDADGVRSAEKQQLFLSRATAAARRDGPAFYEP